MASTIIISLLLLVSLLPNPIFTGHVGLANITEVKPHSRPYMVSVQQNNSHTCSGFLVSDEYVLTAAQCGESSENLTVVVGAHDLKNETEGFIRIGVKSYHQHPNFSQETFMNDIMLLRLGQNIIENEKIRWIPIPTQEEDIEVNTTCSVAGWGTWNPNTNNEFRSNRLMEQQVKIINNTTCENKWGEDKYSAAQMMCVCIHGGSCLGCGGGPLVCGDTAVGITSFGKTHSTEFPDVYTKISAYLPWIKRIIGWEVEMKFCLAV